jgi:hypothetical protein
MRYFATIDFSMMVERMLRKQAATLICVIVLSACGPVMRAQLEKKPDDDILADLRGGGNERICRAGYRQSDLFGQRTQEIARREAALRQLGDCSNEHAKCVNFGFSQGTPGYADCRMRIEGIKVQEDASQAASRAASNAAFANSQMLFQSMQPRQPPSINCTSTTMGNIVNTNCR